MRPLYQTFISTKLRVCSSSLVLTKLVNSFKYFKEITKQLYREIFLLKLELLIFGIHCLRKLWKRKNFNKENIYSKVIKNYLTQVLLDKTFCFGVNRYKISLELNVYFMMI